MQYHLLNYKKKVSVGAKICGDGPGERGQKQKGKMKNLLGSVTNVILQYLIQYCCFGKQIQITL
jgi:hypothetical protein